MVYAFAAFSPASHCRPTFLTLMTFLVRCHYNDGRQVADRAVLSNYGAFGPLGAHEMHISLTRLAKEGMLLAMARAVDR